MTLAKGDTVYLKDGTRCEYVGNFDGNHVVYMLYEHSEEIFPEATIVGEVFESPPTVLREQKLVELEEKIRAGWGKVHELERRQRELMQENDRMLKIQPKYLALQSIDDFMEGRIKFVVVTDKYTSIKLQTFEEAITSDPERGAYRKGMKFLTLFGTTNGDLQWRISDYSNSEGDYSALPFHSFEAACTYVQEYLSKEGNKHLLGDEHHRLNRLMTSFQNLEERWPGKFQLPEAVVAYFRASEKKCLEDKKRSLEQEYSVVLNKLASFESET